ncbi:MAG: hypothetical protein JWP52_1768, partial [Rhizobacter sp.]|nr:hypothetical protein [Rhizobacter sp.]
LNAFAVADIATVTATTLAAYDVVVLAKMPLTAAQVTMFTTWVNAGGNLIAMAPDTQLASLLGITTLGTTLSNAYMGVDTSASPGNGIVSQTMQFHGTADLYTLNGATRVATLYSTATAALTNPAVTLRSVGTGKAAAFAYDLATSIVYTRQGNPAWASQERDGNLPKRSDDKFFGAAAGDVKPDWVDLSKVAIPQADEQQRLLANLVTQMSLSRRPLPRFWYFPNAKKAVIVMTGDDHGNGGTIGRFNQFLALSPAGCSVANWECVRGTSYVFSSTPMSDAQAAQFVAQGFEVGLHINTGCADFTQASLQAIYAEQVAEFQAKYPSVGPLWTQRHHCISFSDWDSAPRVQLGFGMRLDTHYYYWPPEWVGDVPGVFTGSAMPMRFARLDGSFVDNYQVATQMTDESGQSFPYTVDTLLDRALGTEGYYGAYTVNAHTDLPTEPAGDAVLSSALARGVPIVSARQMLTWLDARNASSFGALSFSSGVLTFTVTKDPAANGLQGMVPTRKGVALLSTITRAGSPVALTVRTIKGVEYAFFAADAGTYRATYANDVAKPLVTATAPTAGATGVSVATQPSVTFGEAMDASTLNPNTFQLRNAANVLVGTTVVYDAGTRTVRLVPAVPLAASTSYTVTLRGGSTDPRATDAAGNALAATLTWSFTTGSGDPAPACPCAAWNASALPATITVADPNAVELGVKFTAEVNGFITGIRFYKGPSNTGTHVGTLWTSAGVRLAQATFISESASGWQQVNFATPVAVTANTVYVASYFAPNGNYSASSSYFSGRGVDSPPLHLLRDGVSGGNGVYAYGASSTFPISTYQSTNYWVDVVFTTVGPVDTVPPAVTAATPANGSTGVAVASPITAQFSEAINPATIGATTFSVVAGASQAVSGVVTYNPSTLTATFAPSSPLAASTTYTATLRGGATDPRIKDVAGNALANSVAWTFATGAAGGLCATPANAIVAENCLTGSPSSEWDIVDSGDPSIQGFATQFSVNRGTTVSFKVKSTAAGYRFDIYRMGYYGGVGARKVATVAPTATLPQTQPNCLSEAATGLVDCGNWAVSGSWAVPANAVSGIYFAKLVRTDTGGSSHIFFIVRNDASTSDLLFQTSDTTWQAYNEYGGNSLYAGSPAGRAYKVSYNRPFNTRSVDDAQDWVFNAEYPMVRWLESNGYDVSYISGIDAEMRGN